MNRYLQFLLIVLLGPLAVSCSGDIRKMVQEEINNVSAKMPGVTILSPFDGEYIETLEKIEQLDGGSPVKDSLGNSVYTIEDKPIVLRGAARRSDFSLIEDDSAYEWKSDRGGVLGKGATLELDDRLDAGDHVITLTVTGDYDKVNSGSVTVHIPHVYTEDFSDTTFYDPDNSSGAFDTSIKSVHLGAYPDLDVVDQCSLTLYSSANTMALSGGRAFIGDGSTITGMSVVRYDTDKRAEYEGDLPTLSASPVRSIASYGTYVYALCTDIINIFRSDYYTLSSMYDHMVCPPMLGLSGAEHIFIDHSSPYAYVIGYWLSPARKVIILDLSSDPLNPAIIGEVEVSESAVKSCVSGNMAAIACRAAGFQLVDVTDRDTPLLLSTRLTPSSCNDVAIDGSHLYAACDNGMYTYSIATPSAPVLVSQLLTIGPSYHIKVLDGKAYISISSLGVGIVDVSDPASPSLGTTTTHTGVVSDLNVCKNGNNTYLLSSSLTSGFTILSRDHSVLHRAGTWGVAMKDVAVYMNHAYIAADNGITVINYTDPAHIKYVTRLTPDEPVNAVAVYGSMLYAGYGSGTIRCFDISVPANPVEEGSRGYSGAPASIAVKSSSAVFMAAGSTIYVTDFSNPDSPLPSGTFNAGNTVESMVISGNLLYWAGTVLMGAVDVSDPSTPALLDSITNPGWEYSGVSFRGDWVFAASGNVFSTSWVEVADFAIPPDMIGMDFQGNTGLPQTLATCILGNYLYVTSTDRLAPSSEHYVTAIYLPDEPGLADFTGFNALQTGGKAERIFTDGTYLFINDIYYGMSIVEPVKPYAGLYNSIDTQSVQSLTISGGKNVSKARAFACANKNDQYITLELSNDGGDTWFTADSRMLLEFPFYSAPDGTLKWRATMKTANRLIGPEIYSLKIEYWE